MRNYVRGAALAVALTVGFVILGGAGGCGTPDPPDITAAHAYCSGYNYSWANFPADANVTIHSKVEAARVGNPLVVMVQHNNGTLLQPSGTLHLRDEYAMPNGGVTSKLTISWTLDSQTQTRTFDGGGLCPDGIDP